MLPAELVEVVGKTFGFGISIDDTEKFNAIKVWSLDDIMWKRIKSLHQLATKRKEKQINCDEAQENHSG